MLAVEYIAFILFGIGCGAFMNFFDDCLYPDMIFEKYGKWVQSLGFWGKPIGGCILCTSFWFTTFMSLFVFGLNLTEWLFAIGFSHYSLIYFTQEKSPKIYTMKCCCENIFNVGCVSSCENIKISFDTEESETYTVIAKTNGIESRFETEKEPDGIIIYAGNLNENSTSVLAVFNSKNEQLTFNIEGIEYDCILVTTRIIV